MAAKTQHFGRDSAFASPYFEDATECKYPVKIQCIYNVGINSGIWELNCQYPSQHGSHSKTGFSPLAAIMAESRNIVIGLKDAAQGRDALAAVWDLNSNICRNSDPKVDP